MKILFLLPYPLKQAPSQRFRVEQYLPVLAAAGHTWEIQTFLIETKGRPQFSRKSAVAQTVDVFLGFARRLGILLRIRAFDVVFIHREAAPVGPPVIEWMIAFFTNSRIVYDFDDAIWLTDDQHESWIKKMVKWRSKVRSICRWSYKISCGNEWLAEFATRQNQKVVVNPTTIDTTLQHARSLYTSESNKDNVTIGWTGSSTTLKYLAPLESVLQRLESEFPHLKFLVIADRPPAIPVPMLQFRKWSIESEAKDLMSVDIGVMPLPDDEWSKGKCGFKALQYMAMEIPVVLSPVGANLQIVTEGEDGFFASSETEWYDRLSMLITDGTLRREMGRKGRSTVVNHYSVSSNSPVFLSLFE